MVTEGRRRWGSRCPPLPGGSSDNGAQVEVFGASRLDATARGSAQRSPPASHLPCSSRGCQVLPGCPFPPPTPSRPSAAPDGPARPAPPRGTVTFTEGTGMRQRRDAAIPRPVCRSLPPPLSLPWLRPARGGRRPGAAAESGTAGPRRRD